MNNIPANIGYTMTPPNASDMPSMPAANNAAKKSGMFNQIVGFFTGSAAEGAPAATNAPAIGGARKKRKTSKVRKNVRRTRRQGRRRSYRLN